MVQTRVVAYLRVSTDVQAEHGNGLEIQERAIRAWARANKSRVVAVFTDAGVSGSNGLDTRAALPDALAAIAVGGAEGLIVYRLDRLARDLVLQEQLLMEVRKLGAQVFSTAGGEQEFLRDDPDDPSRRMIRQILGAVNEYERGMIRLRLRRGQQRKAEKGEYAGGRPPYGYSAAGGSLAPNPPEQAIVERAGALRKEGASLRDIGRVLESEGFTPRKEGSRWHPVQVARLLERSETGPDPRSLPSSSSQPARRPGKRPAPSPVSR